MPPMGFNYFPTEVLIIIAEYVSDLETYRDSLTHNRREDAKLKRQSTLFNFCLVCHQWYSVGIEPLYREPSVADGNRFMKFTQTLCPPTKARNKTKSDLGSMIHVLNLGRLVHQSSNSVTARLLNKASENLVNFTAPRVSFSLNALASLAKCRSLKYLDLSRVGDSSLSFPQLKKAVSKLASLRSLSLPIYIPLTRTLPTTGTWPSSLTRLTIGGRIDPKLMENFDWPPNVTELVLSNCKNMTVSLINNILMNDNFQYSLTDFVVETDCNVDKVDLDESTSVLSDLDALEHIKMPVDLIWSLLMLEDGMPAFSIRSLILTETIGPYGAQYPIHHNFCDAVSKSLESGPLSNLWFFKAPPSLLKHYGVDSRKLDELVTSHLDNVDDDELDELGTGFGFQVQK